MASGFGFPAYNVGGQTYHGDEYIFKAAQNLSSDIYKTWDQINKNETSRGFNDEVIQELRDNGSVSDEEYQKYQDMNLQKQNGFIHGKLANVIAAQRKAELENDVLSAHAAAYNATAAHAQALADQVAATPDEGAGGEYYDTENSPPGWATWHYHDAKGRPATRLVQIPSDMPTPQQSGPYTMYQTGPRNWRIINPRDVKAAGRQAAQQQQEADVQTAKTIIARNPQLRDEVKRRLNDKYPGIDLSGM